MRIAGTPHFSLPTINNRLDLSNIKRAEVEVRDIPEPGQNNRYTYVGGFETYSNKSMSENIGNLRAMLNNIEAKEPEWKCYTMALPTGETFQLKYDNAINLRVTNIIDIQI